MNFYGKGKFKRTHHQHHGIQPMLEGYFSYDVTSWLVTLQICVYCNQTIAVVKIHQTLNILNWQMVKCIVHC